MGAWIAGHVLTAGPGSSSSSAFSKVHPLDVDAEEPPAWPAMRALSLTDISQPWMSIMALARHMLPASMACRHHRVVRVRHGYVTGMSRLRYGYVTAWNAVLLVYGRVHAGGIPSYPPGHGTTVRGATRQGLSCDLHRAPGALANPLRTVAALWKRMGGARDWQSRDVPGGHCVCGGRFSSLDHRLITMSARNIGRGNSINHKE
jgi:hypothetical protein